MYLGRMHLVQFDGIRIGSIQLNSESEMNILGGGVNMRSFLQQTLGNANQLLTFTLRCGLGIKHSF